jgi:Flp pilus assembly protein TadB
MSFTTDPNVLLIYGLIFVLGLLVGVFLTAGGRRKWKTRYNSEAERRKALERDLEQRAKDLEEREKEWRERARESLRAAAIKDPTEPGDGEIRSV